MLTFFGFLGQSFMLHQIRKMVGTLMAVTRGFVEPDYITRAFDPNESVHLPTAPGLGLLLEQVLFYFIENARVGRYYCFYN